VHFVVKSLRYAVPKPRKLEREKVKRRGSRREEFLYVTEAPMPLVL